MSAGPSILGVPAIPDERLRAETHRYFRFRSSLDRDQEEEFHAVLQFRNDVMEEARAISFRAGALVGFGATGLLVVLVRLFFWAVTP